VYLKRQFAHFDGGFCNEVEVSSALYGSNPEDVVAFFGFEEFLCPSQCFFDGFGGLVFCDFPACGYVEYGGDVAAYAFLVIDYLLLSDSDVAVD
jgi:hypothetical protein